MRTTISETRAVVVVFEITYFSNWALIDCESQGKKKEGV